MAPSTAAKTTPKGEETRAQILAAAVEQASAAGFESITIGTLAERTGMSKSGLFAHFGSRLELQIAAVDEASRRFAEQVFMPALKAPRGIKRLRALFDLWIDWPQRASLPGGCPLDAAMREYDHQPGPMRDAVMERHRTLSKELVKAVQLAIDNGDLRPDTDASEFAFAMFGIILAFMHGHTLMGAERATRIARNAFDGLVARHTAP